VSKNKRPLVWDLAVRCLHWLLAAGVAAAWVTSSSTGPAHENIGLAGAAVVALRLAWGFVGTPHARFARFVRRPATTLRYLRQVAQGTAPRYLGHNPLGGWMVVMLLAATAAVTASGWLATTDAFWGYAWPVRVHAALAWAVVALVALHVAGVAFTSWQHRENLVAAMFTGRKDGAQPGDVD
jgi:cytochrome b